MTRRDLLCGGAAVGAAALLPRLAVANEPKPFRLVHMTDFHVQPELRAPQGMEAALKHAMGKRPDMVMLGGDLVMDAAAATRDRAKQQWDVFNSLLRANCHVATKYCVGNHDVWGWDKNKSRTSGNEPLWGKQWFMDIAGIDKTYYSFEAGGWKGIVLDTVHETEKGYEGLVDADQFEWLDDQLSSTSKDQPIFLVSHIPLFSPSPMVYGYDTATGSWKVGGSSVTKNFNQVKKLFDRHSNVKLCLSGHIHLVDRYDYNGVSYLCNGAVCGAWWLGKNKDFEPGYVVIDLNRDGTFKQEFVKWGWKPA